MKTSTTISINLFMVIELTRTLSVLHVNCKTWPVGFHVLLTLKPKKFVKTRHDWKRIEKYGRLRYK